jgi:hypothetical protein
VGIAVVVIAVDATGQRTMSDAFKTAVRHPVLGPAVLGSWGYLTAHLVGVLPPKYDLFHRAACRGCSH